MTILRFNAGDYRQLVRDHDPLVKLTTLAHDGCNGHLQYDIDPFFDDLQAVLVCDTCGWSTQVNSHILGPRDTTSRRV